MKRIIKKISCLLCAVVLMAGFAGCNGKTAYEIAVENGFKGTEAEWLASLKGQNGTNADKQDINELYDAAVANGYKGTFLEFLKEYLQVDMSENNNTEQIAKNCMSVVSITCGFSKTVKTSSGIFGGGTTTTTENYASAGSGVFISVDKEAGNAYIVTNYHVLYDKDCNTANKISDAIYVYPYGAYYNYDKEKKEDLGPDGIRASYVGGAMDYDIAILQVAGSEQIKNSDVQAAKIGDSEKVKVGEKAYAIGNPGGDGISVTSGLISVASEYISMSATDGSKEVDGTDRMVSYRVMRTDTAINPGNSGGGFFNADGELIGITNAKSIESTVDNICYVIPINIAFNLWENLLDNGGTVKKALLGIEVQKVDTDTTLENGEIVLKDTFIITNTAIQPGTAAYGKLQYLDKILAMTVKTTDGKETTYELTRFHHMMDALFTVRKGDTVSLKVERDGSVITVEIKYDRDSYFTVLS